MESRRRIWPLVVPWIAAAFGALAYRILVYHRLEQTAALFVGLPTVLAVALVVTAKPKSIFGSAMMAVTLLLLVSFMFLGEGFICILMAAPLFYAVAAVIAVFVDAIQARRSAGRNKMLIMLPFVALSFEGVNRYVSLPRENTITVERVVNRDAAAVERGLSHDIRLSRDVPVFLQLGFPLPTEARGEGLEVGSEWRLRFATGEMVGRIWDRGEQWALFEAGFDETPIAHWLSWQSARIEWSRVDAGHTRVRFTIRYRRLLDPIWYFAPLERYGVRVAGEYFIDSAAAHAD